MWLPDQRTYVALCFEFNPKTGPRISGIGLDLTDMKNKATLINTVPSDSWLNPSSNGMIINNLELTNGPHLRKQHNNRNYKNNNNNNRGGPCDDSQMQQPQWNDANSMDSFSTFNNNFPMTPAMTPAAPSMSQQQTPTMTPVSSVSGTTIPSFSNISYPQSMPSTPSIIPLPTPSVPMNLQLLSVQTAQYQAEAQYFQQFLMVPLDPNSVPNTLNIPSLASLQIIPQEPTLVSTPGNVANCMSYNQMNQQYIVQ